jgi:mRNA-degrading endonuclease RelE of RelBE toxin-antitoxin system
MRIERTERFDRRFGKLDRRIRLAFEKKLRLLLETYPHCPTGLNVEKLKKSKTNQHSFRVTRDYRVIFTFSGNALLLLDIVSHDEFDREFS